MKQKIIQALPPRLFVALKKWGWYGNFKSWQEAARKSIGYSSDNILEKVKESLLKVKNGEAVYERDSAIFDEIEYSWEVLSGLMWIAAQNKGELNIIDFGGSLGSTYYQNKTFLDKLQSVRWNIVEQPNFVEEGKRSFEDDSLRFYFSVDECIESSGNNKNQCILFSGVLPYLEEPYSILEDVIQKRFEYIIIDRTGFTPNNKTRLTVQKVPSKIYNAIYPCWFFCENELLSFFEKNGYELIICFPGADQINIPSVYKGFIFRLKM